MSIRTHISITVIAALMVMAFGPNAAAQSSGAPSLTFYEARKCAYLAIQAKDNARYGRWDTLALQAGSKLTQAQRQDEDRRASDMVSWYEDDEVREHYAACQSKLGTVNGSAASAPASPFTNPFAPPPFTEAEKKELVRTSDAARFRQLNDKDLSWTAYCVVASEGLAQLALGRPAALGLDPGKAADAQTIKRIEGQRNDLSGLYKLRFARDQEPLAKEHYQRQAENFKKGLEPHRSTDAGMGGYTIAQSAACDGAFVQSLGLAR